MIVDVCQRWNDGRDSYRPAREVIEPSRFEVAEICDDTTPKDFVCRHHYSGSYPSARVRLGLYFHDQLVGVAVFSTPQQPLSLACVPGDAESRVELGRFVLLDAVPANGESWFLGRCFELLRREHYTGVIAFSDPCTRTNADGVAVFGGHVGTIYQATNAAYQGTSKPEIRRLLPDGTLLPGRALAKVRKRDQGWRYAARRLERFGATPLREDEDAAAWVQRWCSVLTRPLRHPGNHKYAWALGARQHKRLNRRPYPKWSPVCNAA